MTNKIRKNQELLPYPFCGFCGKVAESIGVAVFILSLLMLFCSCDKPRLQPKTASVASGTPIQFTDKSSSSIPLPGQPKPREVMRTPPRTDTKERGEVLIDTELGVIEIRLFIDDAPKTVENFEKLIREKFYDGVTFHRIKPGESISTGDPNTKDEDPDNDGKGGPGYFIPSEIKRKHEKGTVSMSLLGNTRPDTGGSQFFICLAEKAEPWDGLYTVFGKVVSGMDVVEKIAECAADDKGIPSKPVVVRGMKLQEIVN